VPNHYCECTSSLVIIKVVLSTFTTLCRLLDPKILQFTETDTLKPVTEHTNCMGAPSFRVMGHKRRWVMRFSQQTTSNVARKVLGSYENVRRQQDMWYIWETLQNSCPMVCCHSSGFWSYHHGNIFPLFCLNKCTWCFESKQNIGQRQLLGPPSCSDRWIQITLVSL